MALDESVVLRIEEALAKIQQIDERLTRLFGKAHELKVSTADASKKIASIKAQLNGLTERNTIKITVATAEARAALASFTSAYTKATQNRSVFITVNSANAIEKLQRVDAVATAATRRREIDIDIGLDRLAKKAAAVRSVLSPIIDNTDAFERAGAGLSKFSIAFNRVIELARDFPDIGDKLSKLDLSKLDIDPTRPRQLGEALKVIKANISDAVDGLSKMGSKRITSSLDALSASIGAIDASKLTALAGAFKALDRSISGLDTATASIATSDIDGRLSSLASSLAGFDAAGISKVSSSIRSLSSSFSQLDDAAAKVVASGAVDKLNALTGSLSGIQPSMFAKVGSSIRSLARGLDDLGEAASKVIASGAGDKISGIAGFASSADVSNLAKLAGALKGIARESEAAAASLAKLASSTIASDIASIASGLDASIPSFDRFSGSLRGISRSLQSVIQLAPQAVAALGALEIDTFGIDKTGVAVGDMGTRSKVAADNIRKLRGELSKLTKQTDKLQAVEQVSSLGDAAGLTSSRIRELGRSLTWYVSLPIAAVVGGAGALAFAFDQTIARIRLVTSAAEFSTQRFGQMVQGIKDIAAETGQTPLAVAKSFYFLASAVDAANVSLSTIRVAAQAASLGLGEAEVIADALTSVVNAYGREAYTASQAGEILFEAVRAAKVEAANFAPTLGRVLPIAAQLGVGFEEVAAALALLTRTGNSAAIAATQLRSLMLALVKPPQSAADALASVGLKFADLRRVLSQEGFVGVLDLIASRFGANEEAVTKLFRRQEGYLALLQLSENGFRDYREILELTTGALDNVSGNLEAFTELQKISPSQRLREEFSKLLVVVTDFGLKVLPTATSFVKALNSIVDAVSGLFRQLGPFTRPLATLGLTFAAVAGPALTLFSVLRSGAALLQRFVSILSAPSLLISNIANRFSDVAKGVRSIGAEAREAEGELRTFASRSGEIDAKARGIAASSSIASTALAAVTGYITGAAFAAGDLSTKLISASGALVGIGFSAANAASALAPFGPKVALAGAAFTALAGAASFAFGAIREKERQARQAVESFAASLRGLPIEDVLVRLDIKADSEDVKGAAVRARQEFEAAFKEAFKGDQVTEIELDQIVAAVEGGFIDDFDDMLVDAAKDLPATLEKNAKGLAKSVATSVADAAKGLKAEVESIGPVIIDKFDLALPDLELQARAFDEIIGGLPDDAQELAYQLQQVGLAWAEVDRTTGLASLKLADTGRIIDVLTAQNLPEATRALDLILPTLVESTSITDLLDEKVRSVTNSFGTLTQTAEGELEVNFDSAIDDSKELAEALEKVIGYLTNLLGLSREQELQLAIGDAVQSAAELSLEDVEGAPSGAELVRRLLDFGDFDLQAVRSDVADVVESFIQAVSEGASRAAETGDKQQLDVAQLFALTGFEKLKESISESLKISTEDAALLLAGLGVTVEGINLLFDDPNVELLVDTKSVREDALAEIQAALDGIDPNIPLSVDFEAKDTESKLDELATIIAALPKSKRIDLIADLAMGGNTEAIEILAGRGVISREVFVNMTLDAIAGGSLSQGQLDALLGNVETGEFTLEAIIEYKAKTSGKSKKEIAEDIRKAIESGRPYEINSRLVTDLSESATSIGLFASSVERKKVVIPVSADTAEATGRVNDLIDAVPETVTTTISADTLEASSKVASLVSKIKEQRPTLTIDVALNIASAVNAAVARVRSALRFLSFAEGGIIDRGIVKAESGAIIAAAGGLSTPSIARRGGPMIARPKPVGILWAEPETEGEAYIPFASRHRRRATAILSDVAERFGFALIPRSSMVQAASGFVASPPAIAPRVEGVERFVMATDRLAASISDLASKVQSIDSSVEQRPVIGSVTISTPVADPHQAAILWAAEVSRMVR